MTDQTPSLPDSVLSPGPWWWRLRCRLSQRVLRLGMRLEPDDQVTAHEVLPDGNYRFFDARRPA